MVPTWCPAPNSNTRGQSKHKLGSSFHGGTFCSEDATPRASHRIASRGPTAMSGALRVRLHVHCCALVNVH